jgi:D-alanyl-D-alanine carboxypeptidase
VVNHHGDNPMPLMSTFKVTVAAEYAWQVTQGKIQENTWIDVETQLNLYYLPNVDTEHGKWLKLMFESGNIING